MANNIAIVTGGTSGIGLGIAREMAKAGYHLLVNGLEPNGADIAAGLAKDHNVKVIFSGANLMFPEQIEGMIKLAHDTFGQVDVLVNNAGIQHVSPIQDFPTAKWDAIIAINLTSAFHTTRLVWSGMMERKFGRIINIASAHGLVASEFKSAYVASKHGILGFTKTMALEGAPHGITANAICPGYVHTPLVDKQIKDQAIAHGIPESKVVSDIMLLKQPIKDFVTVEALGALTVLLASEHGKLFTGACIPVDGGWTAQ
jgi:3-hydroxybutyrate dehydrogenase